MSPSHSAALPRSLLVDPTEAAIPVATSLLTDPQFDEPLASLMSFLMRSLDGRNEPEQLIELQAEMISFLLWAQESQKRLAGELNASAATDTEHYYSPGVVPKVCKRLQGIVRQIADGIAWRALAYDRPVLRILAQKPHTGHMEPTSAETELIKAATHVVNTGEIVVLNDLTNFLRYGDLTSVGEDGVTIHEVKAGQGAAKSGRTSRQKRKADEVMEFIRRGFVMTEEGEKKIVDLRTKPVAHLGELRNLVSEARETGMGHGRLTDCLAVTVLDTIDMSQKLASGTKISALLRNPFEQSKDAHTFNSLRLFNRFTWNVAPYSVFPLSPEDRLAIMTGKLWVISFFNFGNLHRCLRRRNLRVRPPTEEGYADLEGLSPGDIAARELDNPWIVWRNPPGPILRIPMSNLARLFYELLDEDSLADAVEEELEMAPVGPTFLHSGFQAEASLWD